MSLQSAVTLLGLLCYAALILVVVRQGLRGNPLNQIFALYLLTMLLWLLAYLMVTVSGTAASALFWYRLVVAVVSGQFVIYFAFTKTLLRIRGSDTLLRGGLLVWALTVVWAVLVGKPSFFTGVHRDPVTGLFVPTFGPLLPIVAAPNYFFLAYAILHLLRSYSSTKSSLQRSRIQYLLLGVGTVTLGTAINFVPRLQPYPIDVVANIFNALCIAYAILRYQLLDIRLALRKGLFYSIPTAIIGFMYFAITFMAVGWLHLVAGYQLLLSLLLGAVTALIAEPLRSRVQSMVDRLFFREQYDRGLMLQNLSRTAASVLELDRLTSMILDAVTTTMHITTAAFFLRHEQTGEFSLAAQKGLQPSVDFRLRQDHPIVEWLCQHERVLTKRDLELEPLFRALWGQERKDLEKLDAELYIPLQAKGRLVGVFALGPKLSGQSYLVADQLTLSTLANQTAVAVENARLYQQTIDEKARAEAILHETFSGMLVVDSNLHVVSMNAGAEQISGYAAKEVLGRHIGSVFGAGIVAPGSPLIITQETGTKMPPVETMLAVKQGSKDILLGVTPLSSSEQVGTHYLLSFADISKLKEVDRLKSRIVANVSHELRTPLASIKAYTELLLDGAERADTTTRRAWLEVIARESDRLTALITDLLDLSRLESGRYQLLRTPVSLAQTVADVLSSLQIQIQQRQVTVAVQVPHDLPEFMADSNLISIIVKNLVSNAVKFSHEGEHVQIVAWTENDSICLSVIDNGVGIPQEAIPQLFTTFYRVQMADAAGVQGTGLGLALVREAVLAHGGHIEVESKLGQGSRFTVSIPRQ